MKSKKVDLKKIADALRAQCPFIMFAMLTGLDDKGRLKWLENLELSVFIGTDTGTWYALERILPVITAAVPEAFCEVTLLNRVDAATRFRVIHSVCLYIQEGKEQQYNQFVRHATLDYRILRAQQRRRGIIEND
jgi:hypothetical protein